MAKRIFDVIIDSGDESGDDEFAPDGGDDRPDVTAPARPSVSSVLPDLLLGAALDKATRRRIAQRGATCFLVIVPSSDYVGAIKKTIGRMTPFGAGTYHIVTRDGSERRTPGALAEAEADSVDALAEGRTVIGITADPTALPAILVSAADVTIHVPTPGAHIIRRVMRACLSGRPPRDFCDGDVSGLSYRQVLSALRPTGSAADAVFRLRALRQTVFRVGADDRLPDLRSMRTFGDARTWGLTLARDIADVRAGKIGWADVDRGVVLHGPPGVGKTLFARILGNACGLPTIVASIGEFFSSTDGHLGAVIKFQHDLFARARALAPCILFLDEIDSLPNRSTLDPHNRDWWVSLVNDFLSLVDGAVGSTDGIIIVGATNAIERLDPAVLRPGRLEKTVYLGPPDAAGLAEILHHHLGSDLADVDLMPWTRMVSGMTGADAMEAVRRAKRTARHAGRAIIIGDLVGALLPPDTRAPESIHRVAVHEAAHAVLAHVQLLTSVTSASLACGSQSGGQTRIQGLPPIVDLASVEQTVVTLLAGRCAEAVLIGTVSSGAGGEQTSDLAQASALLYWVHASWALGTTLLFRAPPAQAPQLGNFDPALRLTVERDLRRLEVVSTRLVRRHRKAIERVATALEVRRYLDAAEIAALVRYADRSTRRTATSCESRKTADV
ncbi:AAA family ATPase [Siculibacillus lacustris]|uniref:AAA family ATPase n=1 Tax=Siculibacillus lacustris TaxID=1549641 RepID=A0A4Q9VF69_9HYPH|nr:AAA family ATPase [Siculibacillus lacustris]TBW32921.1 AAA family ATPase [Siculibacillus lacustris]